MALKLGEKILKDMYLGDKRIVKAYYNNKLVFEADKPIFVEYIESDGNQYIDTGLIGTYNTKAEVKYTTNSVSGYPAVLGAREASNSKAFCIWGRLSSGYIGANISSRGGVNSGVIPSVGTEYTVSLSNNQLVVNDNTTTFTVSDFTTPTTMLLFDINGGGTQTSTGSNRPLNGRVYYLKIWENGELIQHLRPCLQGNTPCMFDMVEGKYYMNAGTGTFGYGALKVNIDYTRIQAYIDGGMKWATASDNSYSFIVPLTIGKNYKLVWENINNPIDGAINEIFRYGQTDIPTPQSQVLKPCVRTSPQATPVAEFTAVKKYLAVQVSGSVAPIIVENEYLKLYEVE